MPKVRLVLGVTNYQEISIKTVEKELKEESPAQKKQKKQKKQKD